MHGKIIERSLGPNILSGHVERIARLSSGEYAGVEGVARLGTGECPLVGSRDDPVSVNTLGLASDDRFEVLPEIGRYEVGIELLGCQVAQVFGEFGRVVTAKTPRQLILGEISGNELDGIEGVCFTRLPGCKNSVVNHFLCNLHEGKD